MRNRLVRDICPVCSAVHIVELRDSQESPLLCEPRVTDGKEFGENLRVAIPRYPCKHIYSKDLKPHKRQDGKYEYK